MNKSLRKKLFDRLRAFLSKKGFALVRWDNQEIPAHVLEIPAEAKTYLVPDNPKLLKLVEQYKTLDPDLTGIHVWDWRQAGFGAELLRSFRDDVAYVWQLKGVDIPELRYLTSTYYQLVNDQAGALEKFSDDALFGNHLFTIAGKKISREMLDSCNEINFLERILKLSSLPQLKVLDIGAGYGRLAHRFSQYYKNLAMYYCTDGVPLSSFISNYYLTFRGVKNATVVPMPELKQSLSGETIHLAINIHSFSECSLRAIDWWVDTVSALRVPYFMIVPNSFREVGSKLLTNRREDFSGILEKYHYRLIKKEPKYLEPLMQKLGLFPSYYHLFEKIS